MKNGSLWFAFLSATALPPLVLLLEPDPPTWFLIVSALVAVLGLGMALSSRTDANLRLFSLIFSRLLSGSISGNIVGILAFLTISTAFFAWLADGVKEHNPILAFGGLFYALGVAAFAYLYALEAAKPKPEITITHLVTPVSLPQAIPTSKHKGQDQPKPGKESNRDAVKESKDPRDPNRLEKFYKAVADEIRQSFAGSEDWPEPLIKNSLTVSFEGERLLFTPNFFPILALVQANKDTLKRVDLHYAKDTFAKTSPNVKDALIGAIKAGIRAINPNIKIDERMLSYASYDVKNLRNEVYALYQKDLKNRSNEFGFNITSGSATMSAAYTLVAIHGDAVGLYIRQDEDKTLPERIETIRLSALDLPGLADEYTQKVTDT